MKRFAVLLLVVTLIAGASATAEVRLTLSSGMIGDHILHQCSEKIISLIEERTGGEVTVNYYGGDTLGTTQERADMLMAGAVDIDMAALSVYDNYNPRQGIMSAFFMF
ncbi:MAG: hypothetical protein Q4D04_10610, partial [Clostridia bacterium]|nr:hypothetical protein [Clostridia bacterium]